MYYSTLLYSVRISCYRHADCCRFSFLGRRRNQHVRSNGRLRMENGESTREVCDRNEFPDPPSEWNGEHGTELGVRWIGPVRETGNYIEEQLQVGTSPRSAVAAFSAPWDSDDGRTTLTEGRRPFAVRDRTRGRSSGWKKGERTNKRERAFRTESSEL